MPIQAAKELAAGITQSVRFSTLIRRRGRKVILTPREKTGVVGMRLESLIEEAQRIARKRRLEHSIHNTETETGIRKIVVSFRKPTYTMQDEI